MPKASRIERVSLLLATTLFVVEHLRVLVDVGIRFTTEDQTIFWYVAKDYLHFHFTEPLFYGSPYSSHVEALLAAPLMGLGISPHIAVPFATVALTAAPWLLMAWVAWTRGHPRIAAAVLAVSVLLPIDYDAINTQAAHGAGVGMAGIAAALLLRKDAGPRVFAAFGVLSALAVLAYPNAIFIAAPAGLLALTTRYRERNFWIAAGAGTGAGGFLYYLARQFYERNPNYVLHPQWPMGFDSNRLTDGFHNLERHLHDVTPFPLGAQAFLVVIAIGLAAYAWRARRWQIPLAGAVVLVGVIAALGVPKTHDGSTSFTFAYGRVFLALPLTVAMLLILAADDLWPVPATPPSPQLIARGFRARVGAAFAGILVLGFGLWKEATLSSETDRVLHIGSPVVSIVPTERVLRDCADLQETAKAKGAEAIIETQNRVNAYGCGALSYRDVDTVYPPYDRRTRHLLDERDLVRHVVLITNVNPAACAQFPSRGLECEMAPNVPNLAVVRSPGESVLKIAARLGIPVRRL